MGADRPGNRRPPSGTATRAIHERGTAEYIAGQIKKGLRDADGNLVTPDTQSLTSKAKND